MLSAVIRNEDAEGKVVGLLALEEKVFSSGRRGFFGQGKVVIDGERYQMQAQLVKIEPKAEAERDA